MLGSHYTKILPLAKYNLRPDMYVDQVPPPPPPPPPPPESRGPQKSKTDQD